MEDPPKWREVSEAMDECKILCCVRGQGLIQDFLLGGGETIFLKKFWIFSDSRTDEFSYIILVIVYSLAIDQFKYSNFVCLPVFSVCEGIC